MDDIDGFKAFELVLSHIMSLIQCSQEMTLKPMLVRTMPGRLVERESMLITGSNSFKFVSY